MLEGRLMNMKRESKKNIEYTQYCNQSNANVKFKTCIVCSFNFCLHGQYSHSPHLLHNTMTPDKMSALKGFLCTFFKVFPAD